MSNIKNCKIIKSNQKLVHLNKINLNKNKKLPTFNKAL